MEPYRTLFANFILLISNPSLHPALTPIACFYSPITWPTHLVTKYYHRLYFSIQTAHAPIFLRVCERYLIKSLYIQIIFYLIFCNALTSPTSLTLFLTVQQRETIVDPCPKNPLAYVQITQCQAHKASPEHQKFQRLTRYMSTDKAATTLEPSPSI